MASNASEMACPDPAAHKHASKLSEQASTAALYVTDPARNTNPRAAEKSNPLGPDGKLSSASAATSLKYANAKDLPSFPSAGLSAADVAAGKAAMLAKDYKMKELWQPELSAAGSKAALLAHRDGGKLDLWQPEASAAGNSAATLAMRTKGLSPQIDYGYTDDGRSKALLAAALSVSQNKQRAANTPAPSNPAYPDSKNSAANALNAASVSHRASVKMAPDGWSSEANQAARITNSHINPEMFSAKPPVELEKREERHNAALRASAISVAKQMYDYQNRTVLGSPDSAGQEGAVAASARQAPSSQRDIKQEALAYIHLQDAAHKLAQERLAKVDKNLEAERYREYWGEEKKPTSPKKGNTLNRMSMHSRPREDIDNSDDEAQARRIRTQMSKLNSGLNSVDDKKRSEDRARLMAAAEKRVHDRMHDMDERVFSDTGKVPPALMEEWEAKARKRAQEERESQAAHPGMTHIGGGKYINQSDIEAIAAARLKPTLDAINDNAEEKRARDEELRIEKEEQERKKREEKQKHREEKDEAKRVKNEEKAAAKQQKEEEKARKAEEKRAADEEKRAAKEDQRKSREVNSAIAGGIVGAAAGETAAHQDAQDEKKGGTLGRFASKLKRRSKMVGSSEAPVKSEEQTSSATNAAPEENENTLEAAPVAAKDHVTQEEGNLPTMTVLSSGHTGDYTDAQPTPAEEYTRMPNLERHISTIETSSDESDADEEDDDEHNNEARKDASSGFFGAVAASKAAAHDPVSPIEEVPVEHHGAAPMSAVERETGESEMTAPLPLTEEPFVEHHVAETEPVSAVEPETSTAAAPAVLPLTEEPTKTAQPVEVESAPLVAATEEEDSTMHTSGPHVTDTANILDPNVNNANQKLKDVGLDEVAPDMQSTPVKSTEKDEGKKLQKRGAAPVETPIAAATVAAAAGETAESNKLHKKQSRASVDESGEKKGLRGIFGKLKNRASRSSSKPESPKSSATGETKTTAVATTTAGQSQDSQVTPKAAHMGTDGAIDDPAHVSGIEANPVPLAALESPSSYKRGEALPDRDYNDMSSSGDEEEDVQRGRSTHKALTDIISGKALTSKKPNKDAGNSGIRESNDDDQFEEARDHFDETLAPPPAFAGQTKGSSPLRGTKFQEEL
ncbi:Hypothetical protein R9X50_00398900 [Acrodontium crateriforme]|uniref:Eisosome protein 1 n=1 Tax=Acrodontium crateriforme TaxID=150365 RepID=A0AAQ3R7Y9_9PEZI|nr:Hypothetical protein R9X50_00398900 [Acrodontium crateriforme]